MYEKGTTSKKGDRGIGLYEVRQILNQYPNALLSTEYKECIFTQKLTLLYPFNPN
ncbi:GHKL domain-containing protein [Lachnospiraceae bacterium]|nr:GHKL domain-containing protein [Lachnospiraceae bacterium]